MARVGPGLGAKATGASVYELPPTPGALPVRLRVAEEEWLLALNGTPTVRDPEGERRLGPMDLVFFPTGPEGAHRVQNDTDETARVLMWSPVLHPAATVYPDSDRIAVWAGNKADDLIARRSRGSSTSTARRGGRPWHTRTPGDNGRAPVSSKRTVDRRDPHDPTFGA